MYIHVKLKALGQEWCRDNAKDPVCSNDGGEDWGWYIKSLTPKYLLLLLLLYDSE